MANTALVEFEGCHSSVSPIPIRTEIHVSGSFLLPAADEEIEVGGLLGWLAPLSASSILVLPNSRHGLQEHDPKWIRAIE